MCEHLQRHLGCCLISQDAAVKGAASLLVSGVALMKLIVMTMRCRGIMLQLPFVFSNGHETKMGEMDSIGRGMGLVLGAPY
jgi:hypothetical protein